MACLRVSLVYLSDVSCLPQNDFYVRRISHNAFPNISSGNSHLFLQIWGRERKGSWHTDVFSWCAYRHICCTLHVCNVTGNELAQLAFSGRFNELTSRRVNTVLAIKKEFDEKLTIISDYVEKRRCRNTQILLPTQKVTIYTYTQWRSTDLTWRHFVELCKKYDITIERIGDRY